MLLRPRPVVLFVVRVFFAICSIVRIAKGPVPPMHVSTSGTKLLFQFPSFAHFDFQLARDICIHSWLVLDMTWPTDEKLNYYKSFIILANVSPI